MVQIKIEINKLEQLFENSDQITCKTNCYEDAFQKYVDKKIITKQKMV